MLFVNPAIQIPFQEFDFTYARSSGPGGQNVNKVNSKCVLRWDVLRSPTLVSDVKLRLMHQFANRLNKEGVLILSSDRSRDQKRNYQDCLDKLTEMIRSVAHPPKKRTRTKPTQGSRRRRLKEKKSVSEKKSFRVKPGSTQE